MDRSDITFNKQVDTACPKMMDRQADSRGRGYVAQPQPCLSLLSTYSRGDRQPACDRNRRPNATSAAAAVACARPSCSLSTVVISIYRTYCERFRCAQCGAAWARAAERRMRPQAVSTSRSPTKDFSISRWTALHSRLARTDSCQYFDLAIASGPSSTQAGALNAA